MAEARGALRLRVLDVASQWAQFAGWLNANTGRRAPAGRLYDLALECAIEAGQPNMAATALNMKGHLAWIAGNVGPMIGLSQAAQRDRNISPGVRALAVQQEARGHALTGDGDATDRELDEAAELVTRAVTDPASELPWIYFFNPDFLGMQRALAYQPFGRHEEAIALLSEGLTALPADVRQSERVTWYQYRLAAAYAHAATPDEACAVASEAAANARAIDSARTLGLLRHLHGRLAERWPTHPAVVDLADVLR